MNNRYSSQTPPAPPTPPKPGSPPCSCHFSPQSPILETTVINKLLNFLTDLLQQSSSRVSQPTSNAGGSGAQTPPSEVKDPTPTQANDPPSSGHTQMSSGSASSQPTVPTTTSTTPSHSINSLDEFASDLSMDCTE